MLARTMKPILMLTVAVFVLLPHFGCKSEGPAQDAQPEVAPPGTDAFRAEVQPGGSGGTSGEVGGLDTPGIDVPLGTGGLGGGIDAVLGTDTGGATDTGGGNIDVAGTEAGPSTSVDAAIGVCATDNDCTLNVGTGCCGGCYAAGDPLPPSMPCSSACPGGVRASTCACVNSRCTVGYLPAGAACDPTRDLCLGGTKCCAACTGSGADGGLSCAAAVCTTLTTMTMPSECPAMMPPSFAN